MLEPEPKISDAWSWSLKVEFRFHSPGQAAPEVLSKTLCC